jgi:hypothetical protein
MTDLRRVLLVSKNGVLATLITGEIYPSVEGFISSIRWSPDNRYLAMAVFTDVLIF